MEGGAAAAAVAELRGQLADAEAALRRLPSPDCVTRFCVRLCEWAIVAGQWISAPAMCHLVCLSRSPSHHCFPLSPYVHHIMAAATRDGGNGGPRASLQPRRG